MADPSPRARGVPLRLACFASGGGTNLQALLDWPGKRGVWEVVVVVSDKEDAGALDRARAAHVRAATVPVKGRDPARVAEETLELLRAEEVEMILLAGYLRLLPPELIAAFRGRVLNIHPALLPAFGGKGMYGIHVHEAVLRSGATVSGATVHLVDERYDQGRALAQWPVPVLAADTPASLAARVLEVEHLLYPRVVQAYAGTLLRQLPPRDGSDPEAPGSGASGSATRAAALFDPPGEAFALADPDPARVAAQLARALSIDD